MVQDTLNAAIIDTIQPKNMLRDTPQKRTKRTSSRSRGGEQTHLSVQAVQIVKENILAGKTNNDINHILQRNGFLPPGAVLSTRTYTTYRSSPEVKVQRQRLTDEALQTGHAALSEAIVSAVHILDASAALLIGDDAGLREGDIQEQRLAVQMFFKAANFLWDRLGWKDVFKLMAEQEKEEQEAREQAEQWEEAKAEFILEMKEKQNQILREMLDRRKQSKAEALAREADALTSNASNENALGEVAREET